MNICIYCLLQVIIFVKSVQRCMALAQLLVDQNFPAIAIHRVMTQEERQVRCSLPRVYQLFYREKDQRDFDGRMFLVSMILYTGFFKYLINTSYKTANSNHYN